MTRLRHAPFYCEENIWWLAQDARLAAAPADVLVISNAGRSVAMFAQRAGSGPLRVIAWDYHVVLAVPGSGALWDLDCVAGAPLPIETWLDVTFAPGATLPARFQPRFRVVAAADFVATLVSDRSHMRVDGGWRAPPPPWPCVGTGPPNLERFVELADRSLGEVVELAGLRRRYVSTARGPTSGPGPTTSRRTR